MQAQFVKENQQKQEGCNFRNEQEKILQQMQCKGNERRKKNKNKNRLERIIRKIKHERVKQARI
jgi:hypothetical protein